MLRFRVRNGERGAAAVEFALILPVLVILILGIIEFGRIFNVQISITNAAREAARTMAIEDDPVAARLAAIDAAPSVNPALTAANIVVSPTDCVSGATVKVTITYPVTLLTGYFDFGPDVTLNGIGAMRCGG
jgi:Flp pilus assembly protein TadG